VVDTTTVTATFTNRGARIVGWRLKDYRGNDGEPLDLVPSALPADQPTPFALRVDDEQISRRIDTGFYRVSGDTNGRVDATTNPARLSFDYEEADGVRVHKEFRFEPRNYVTTFSATVSVAGKMVNPTVQWGPGLGDIGAAAGGGSFFTGNYIQPPELIVHTAGKVERVASANLTERPVREGEYRFAGVDDHYFIATTVNPGVARLEAHALMVPGEGGTQRQFVVQSFKFPGSPRNVRFFFGPKQFDLLKEADG
jgi:YidC/Oxa1 family membrane protein insertase